MKNIFTILLLSISFHCFSQELKYQSVYTVPDNLTRYQLDYEIKDATAIDTSLVLSLNLDQYEYLREETVNVEVYDNTNSITIILYSIITCQENKQKTNLIQRR